MPKSCLKFPTPPMTPGDDCCQRRKCVAFCAEDLERVYIADEWDRTPAEVAQKLSYGDVLELKAIQRSLPTAPQLPDPLARRPQAQYLKQVPIGLLPIFDDAQPCNSVAPTQPAQPPPDLPPIPSRLPSSSNHDSIPSIYSPTPSKSASQTRSPLLSASHSMSASPNPRRPRPNFAFLPLLDTPNPPPSTEPPSIPHSSDLDMDDSDHDLSTPALSTASLDTTPSPRELSDSEQTQGYFHLPQRRKESSSSYFPPCPAPPHKSGSGAFRPPPLFPLYPPNTTIRSKSQEPKKPPHKPTDSQTFDINGETFHFGPVSTPPDSPLALSPSLSSLSLPTRPPLPSSPPKYTQARGQDSQSPSHSRPASTRNQSPSPKSNTSPRPKEIHPSPILSVSMKRASGASLCSSASSVVGLPIVRAEAMVGGGGKGRLEH